MYSKYALRENNELRARRAARCTPLHYAAGSGDVNLCKRLVKAGANASTADFHKYTAVDYAKQSRAMDCVAYLEDITGSSGASNPGDSFLAVDFPHKAVLPALLSMLDPLLPLRSSGRVRSRGASRI